MAEMQTKEGGGGGGGKQKGHRGKKLSTRVDLTPMVDLGFLLITFFMLTTTLQKPKTMNLFLPKDTKDSTLQNKVKESQALTILLGKDHRVFYYEGTGQDPNTKLTETTFANKGGIRDEIIKKWLSVIQKSGGRDSMVAIIKPTAESDYEDMVNILDEMNINGIKKYALVDSVYSFEHTLLDKAYVGTQ